MLAAAGTTGIGLVTPVPGPCGLVHVGGSGIEGDFSTRSTHGSLL